MFADRAVIFVDIHTDAAASMFVELARYLAGKGCQIHFCHPTPQNGEQLLKRLRNMGAKTHVIESLRGKNHFAIARRLNRIIRNLSDLDPVLVASESVPMRAIALAARQCNCLAIFYILTLRMDAGFSAIIRERYDSRLYKNCNGVLVGCSWATCEHYILRLGLSPTSVRYIPNSIDLSMYPPSNPPRTTIRQELALSESTRIIATIGRLHPVKEQLVLIKAMKILLERHRNLIALIIGSPNPPDDLEYEKSCRQIAEKLGISNQIYFLGQRNDVRDILIQTTVFVIPSWQEGMALALMEAMTCRCTVVSAAIHSACELIQHGYSGFLTPIKDEFALAENLEKALALSTDERVVMGQRARDAIAMRYDRAKVMQLFDPLFLYGKK